MTRDASVQAARRLVRRLDQLGRVSDEAGRLTRTFLSPAMARANRLVGRWMREAGLTVREDGVGNLVGRRPAPPGARSLVIGSHLDTVRDAGRFDGALGVLVGIAALEVLRAEGTSLPFGVEVLGFADEEGVRFGGGYLGSKGYLGRLGDADLDRRDERGQSLRAILAQRRRRGRSGPMGRIRGRPIGYLEVHIEQGPVLESQGRAVGVVGTIAGQTRGRMIFRGRAGHAGTVPMNLRQDALAGAAEWVGTVEDLARRRPPLLATVGTVAVRPGAPNVIPAEVTLSLDLRHPRDAARRAALRVVRARARAIGRRRNLSVHWEPTQDDDAVACDPQLTRIMAAATRAVQGRAPVLVSGAGHDAVVLAAQMPIALLFVRCRAGLSHHPDEFASPADIRTALDVLCGALRHLAATIP